MTIKRFVAPDMRRALDLVREEMGPEAIILSSKRVPQGVEIITSLDTDQTVPDVEFRQEFGRKFDQDLDSPMASDSAWEAHRGVEQAAQRFQGAVQKNPAQPPQLKAARRESLALEIEAARKKMMEAKRREEAGRRESARSTPAPAAGPASDDYPSTRSYDEPAIESFESRDYAQNNEASSNAWQPEDYPPQQATGGQLDQQMAGLAAELQSKVESAPASAASDERLEELQNQIADMRLILEQQMWRMRDPQAGATTAAPRSLAEDTIARHLAQLGLPEALVSELAKVAAGGKHLSASWREALAKLARKIQTPAEDELNAKGGVYALVGPTGVGKTTTIAKLASRYVLEHGLGKVALVTTDTYRVGAHDQLRALGRILNVPVRIADKERPLASVVASLKNYSLILVDTAGFRQGDPLLREQEAMLMQCPGLKRLLVLATNSQLQTLKASTHAFGGANLKGCVLTKLDETSSLGESLGVVIAQKLPVFYTSDGQGIPHDLTAATPHNLVAKAVNIMKTAQAAEQAMSTAL